MTVAHDLEDGTAGVQPTIRLFPGENLVGDACQRINVSFGADIGTGIGRGKNFLPGLCSGMKRG